MYEIQFIIFLAISIYCTLNYIARLYYQQNISAYLMALMAIGYTGIIYFIIKGI
jgi:hypothetical protein